MSQHKILQQAVSEIFGPTVQGEGPSAGQPAAFLRFAGCNLTCTWCDTAYTWNWAIFNKEANVQHWTRTEIIARLMNILYERPEIGLVVISGGEPMLQIDAINDVIDEIYKLKEGRIRFEIETNGTVPPTRHVWVHGEKAEMLREATTFNVSPKLAHSGVALEKRLVMDSLIELMQFKYILKFVVRNRRDLDEARELVDLLRPYDLDVDKHVWVMPLGATRKELGRTFDSVARMVVDYTPWHVTDRMHIRLWDGVAGR